jgi:hypothetical protein
MCFKFSHFEKFYSKHLEIKKNANPAHLCVIVMDMVYKEARRGQGWKLMLNTDDLLVFVEPARLVF